MRLFSALMALLAAFVAGEIRNERRTSRNWLVEGCVTTLSSILTVGSLRGVINAAVDDLFGAVVADKSPADKIRRRSIETTRGNLLTLGLLFFRQIICFFSRVSAFFPCFFDVHLMIFIPGHRGPLWWPRRRTACAFLPILNKVAILVSRHLWPPINLVMRNRELNFLVGYCRLTWQRL